MTAPWVLAGASGVVGRRLLECLGPGPRITILTRGAGGDGKNPSPTDAGASGANHGGPVTVSDPKLAVGQGGAPSTEPTTGFKLPPPGPTRVTWNPPAGPHLMLGGETHWVQMAGSSVADGRLGPDHEKRLFETRRAAGMGLLDAWRKAGGPAGSMTVLSATGFFGDRGDDFCREEDGPGEGPLARVCRDHEAWWREREGELAARGCRLILARLGLVLDPEAPAVQKLLLPLRLGLGGPMGGGRMWWPWVTSVDVARAIVHLAENPGARGIYHLTAPEPSRQIDLIRAMGRALHRPVFVPAPAWALRLALGKGADGLLLNSCRPRTERLLATGFAFGAPDLARALPFVLKVFGR